MNEETKEEIRIYWNKVIFIASIFFMGILAGLTLILLFYKAFVVASFFGSMLGLYLVIAIQASDIVILREELLKLKYRNNKK